MSRALERASSTLQDETLQKDVELARINLRRFSGNCEKLWDDSRMFAVVTAASGSELYIPYTIPLVLRHAGSAGLGVDLVLGLNNGYECWDVLAGFEQLPDTTVIHLKSGDKSSADEPSLVREKNENSPYEITEAKTQHRIFVLHQKAGIWNAGKTQMLLDVLSGFIATNLETSWKPPQWSLLLDAESLFIEYERDVRLLDTLEQSRKSLNTHSGDVMAAATEIFGKIPAHKFTQQINIASQGLVRLIHELRTQQLDAIGAATRFSVFNSRKTLAGVSVNLPSPDETLSAMHLFYNEACGLMSGCFSLPGGGTLARTDVLIALMDVILRKYSKIYGEDALLTVLAEQLGLRIGMSSTVQITNRCPSLNEQSGQPPIDSWKLQFAKWYRGFNQIKELYGDEACRSVIGPAREEVMAMGISLAALAFSDHGTSAAHELLYRFSIAETAFTEIHQLAEADGA